MQVGAQLSGGMTVKDVAIGNLMNGANLALARAFALSAPLGFLALGALNLGSAILFQRTSLAINSLVPCDNDIAIVSERTNLLLGHLSTVNMNETRMIAKDIFNSNG